jgi:hypothetical protein
MTGVSLVSPVIGKHIDRTTDANAIGGTSSTLLFSIIGVTLKPYFSLC